LYNNVVNSLIIAQNTLLTNDMQRQCGRCLVYI